MLTPNAPPITTGLGLAGVRAAADRLASSRGSPQHPDEPVTPPPVGAAATVNENLRRGGCTFNVVSTSPSRTQRACVVFKEPEHITVIHTPNRRVPTGRYECSGDVNTARALAFARCELYDSAAEAAQRATQKTTEEYLAEAKPIMRKFGNERDVLRTTIENMDAEIVTIKTELQNQRGATAEAVKAVADIQSGATKLSLNHLTNQLVNGPDEQQKLRDILRGCRNLDSLGISSNSVQNMGYQGQQHLLRLAELLVQGLAGKLKAGHVDVPGVLTLLKERGSLFQSGTRDGNDPLDHPVVKNIATAVHIAILGTADLLDK